MTLKKLAAASEFPSLTIPLVNGGNATLGDPVNGADWQMVVIYRGKHCPLCRKYLARLDELRQDFLDAGVDVIAASGDPLEKATDQNDGTLSYPIGYGMTVEQMRELGLYISDPRSPQETDRPFPEPGLFVVNADGRIQIVDISNAPFARPDLDVVLSGVKWIRDPKNNYPIRGTHA